MATVSPLRPEQVTAAQQKRIPSKVITVFNQLIAEGMRGYSATILQKAVVNRLVARGMSRGEIFQNGWLDVEDIYRAAGWSVYYDKPGYNEDYEPYFRFTKKRE